MVELPRGDTLETRRGGPDVLRTLARDFFSEEVSGYIRIERIPREQLPRIGQLVISAGSPLAAMHEQSAVVHGLDALLEIEEDALHLDALLSVVSNVDIALIGKLHPEAKLYIDTAWDDGPSQIEGDKWWRTNKAREVTWARPTELPELEPTIETPQFIQRAAAARRARIEGELSGELFPGHSHLIDTSEATSTFQLAAELVELGRPVLILSRQTRERLNEEFGIPLESCWWLTERPGEAEQTCGARFEDITKVIDDFMLANLRAAVILDGLEFLSSVHGTDRLLAFLRRTTDNFHDSDHLLLMPVDLMAWDERERHLMMRESEPISAELVQSWLDDSEHLSDHPFSIATTQDEQAWIDETLKSALELRQTAIEDSGDMRIAPSGIANRLELGEISRDWIEEEEATDTIEEVGPDDDWVPTFHSASPGQAPHEIHSELEEDEEVDVDPNEIPKAVLASLESKFPGCEIVEVELEREDGVLQYELEIRHAGFLYEIEVTPDGEIIEIEIEERPGPRPAIELGQRRERQMEPAKKQSTRELHRMEMVEAAARATEVSETALLRAQHLADSLGRAKQALDAIESASVDIATAISEAQLPISEEDINRKRVISEWDDVVVATKDKVLSGNLPEPAEEHDSWAAAAVHASNPLQMDEKASSIATSPLITRPGVELAKEGRGIQSAKRQQRDMSMTSISRRVAERDKKVFSSGEVVTNLKEMKEGS